MRLRRLPSSGSRRPRRSAAFGSTIRSISNAPSRARDTASTIRSRAGKLDVFIYDLKRNAIPDDAKSAIVRAEFKRSREDVFLAQPRGLQVYLRRNFTVEDPANRTRFQCAAFHLTRDGAKPQDGFLCVTSWNNKFIKFRMTSLSDRENEATARKHMAAWIPVLWSGANAKAEQAAVEPRPRAQRPRRAAPRRAVVRRIQCPPGYICR